MPLDRNYAAGLDQPAIALDGIRHTYVPRSGRAVLALKGVNLLIERNEFVSIVGTSGCGKSTLLRLMAGLITPSAGTLSVLGAPAGQHRRQVALVFQKPSLLPWFNVLDNVLFPLRHMGQTVTAVEQAEAMELLALAGVAEFAQSRPKELSGGMQQRVALCRALITNPTILLMDEPFAALDALTREELGTELLRLCTERPKTVVFVTHSIAEAVLLSDRVLVMAARPGYIKTEITVPLRRPRHAEVMKEPAFQEISTRVREAIYQR